MAGFVEIVVAKNYRQLFLIEFIRNKTVNKKTAPGSGLQSLAGNRVGD